MFTKGSLHIGDPPDLEEALKGVLDSARGLTGSDYAGITTLDSEGNVEDLRASGLTAEAIQSLWEAPDGRQFLEYLCAIPEPLWVADVRQHSSAIVLTQLPNPKPIKSFLAVPIRYQEVNIGNIHLGKEEISGEFSQEDEDTLAMLAAQVALLVTIARRHRDEQRIRKEMEALIDILPVGVVLFDSRNIAEASLNREAARIFRDLLDTEPLTPRLLDTITVRRPCGSTILLRDFPTTEVLGNARTFRAEEIVLFAPGDRSTAVLANAGVIQCELPQAEMVIVTL